MSIVQIDSGAHVTVCNDSRGLTQFAYTRSGSGWHMAGLSAELCEQLASALAGEASRQRREASEDNLPVRDYRKDFDGNVGWQDVKRTAVTGATA